ncbi:N-acetylmuramoyl-L-alanine amidase [Streptomyces sp. SCA3-4]|uniref:N-acetylmuramoyl-L-alanine amidase n=1 Tax=Streptomyces sichuanensis TaxID=2871810 RepID=UPI001CE34D67|nr:N-acetylmuramoyl-L-alanine amidase [Streptomyces sichuanensis]MCA6093668.1 N-acetylmuramoyl-L-alanine amidase [Streptomyces sichuanensis]
MRGIFVSSVVTVCAAAALTLPFLAIPSAAVPAPPDGASVPTTRAPAGAHGVPGATQSLPLVPLGPDRRAAHPGGTRAVPRGLPPREVARFSLVGIVWDDAATELRGRAQIRTREAGTRTWSAWQDVRTHDDRPDPGPPEARRGRPRGATAPLWVGASDAVQVRVRPEGGRASGALPPGLRVELVDPGRDPAPVRQAPKPAPSPSDEETASSAANYPLAPLGATEIPALARPESEKDIDAARVDLTGATDARPPADGRGEADPENEGSEAPAETADDTDNEEDDADPWSHYVGSRPRIVTRAGWGADESIRERGFAYTTTVRAAFVHHTASGNGYSCAQSASLVRGIYRYHVVSSGWRDIGYNFLIDKCGKIYEGRAGGVAKPVRGAHTLGFNANSMGIAVLGSFEESNPPNAVVNALAGLTAWKLGLYDVNPLGTARLVSGGGNLFKKGTTVRLKVISGHRDGYATECPGDRLYKRLGAIRTAAARLQGR